VKSSIVICYSINKLTYLQLMMTTTMTMFACDVQIDASLQSLTDAMTQLDVSLAAETSKYVIVRVHVSFQF